MEKIAIFDGCFPLHDALPVDQYLDGAHIAGKIVCVLVRLSELCWTGRHVVRAVAGDLARLAIQTMSGVLAR